MREEAGRAIIDWEHLKQITKHSVKPALITLVVILLLKFGNAEIIFILKKCWKGIAAVGGYWVLIGAAFALFVILNQEFFRRLYRALMLRSVEYRTAIIACPILFAALTVTYVLTSFLNPVFLILFFLACYQSCPVPQAADQGLVSDTLRRDYFVERLCEIFAFPDSDFRRIAIVGEWGAGKTRVLELLRQTLLKDGQENFRFAFVNPWKASDPEEAMAILARGFDEALGLTGMISRKGLLKYVAVLFKLIPSVGKIGDEVLKVFVGDSWTSDRARLRTINAQLEHLEEKIVILVDDMERASPEVVQRMFPVISELNEFNHCYFVFAIDPDRIAKAFKEGTGPQSETKGYLDKVFDLQISLPDPSLRDVQKWIRELVAEKEFPKFRNSIARLDDLLPQNPRTLLRFVKDAKTKEALFLNRYGPEEHIYSAFFLVQMMEVEFPGIGRVLVRRQDALRASGAKDEGVFDFLNDANEEEQENEFEKLVGDLKTELQVTDLSYSEAARLEQLLRGVLNVAQRDVDTLLRDETNPFDICWCVDDFKTLVSISQSERLSYSNEWVKTAGTLPLSRILEQSQSGRKFDDVERCANEMLGERIDLAKRLISAAWKEKSASEQAKMLTMATGIALQFQKHIRYLVNNPVEEDQRVFGDAVFSSWSKLALDEYGNKGLINEKLWLDLCRTVDGVFCELISFVPIDKCYQFAQPDGFRVFVRNNGYEGVAERERARFDRFQIAFEDRVYQEFRELFHSCDLIQNWPKWLGDRGWNLLYSPKSWLGHSDERTVRFENLVHDARFSDTVQENFLKMVDILFLHPMICKADHDHADQKRWIEGLVNENPEYIRGFWEGARTGGKFANRQADIERLRARAVELGDWADTPPEEEFETGKDFFGKETVESLFPL